MKHLKEFYFKVVLWKSNVIAKPKVPSVLLDDEKYFKGYSEEKIFDFMQIRAIKYENTQLMNADWREEIDQLHKSNGIDVLRFLRLFKVKGGYVPSPKERARIIEIFPELARNVDAYENFLATMIREPELFKEKIRLAIQRDSEKPKPKKEKDSLYRVFFKIVFATDYERLLDTPKFEIIDDEEWAEVLYDLKHKLYFINDEEVEENLQADIDIDTLITCVGGSIIGFGIEEALMSGRLVHHDNEVRKDLEPSVLRSFVISYIHTKVEKGEFASMETNAVSSKGYSSELHEAAKTEGGRSKCHAAKEKARRSSIAKDYCIV